MSQNKITYQLIWGVALVLMGLAVFYRIPQIMPRIVQIEQFAQMKGFLYFCFYFMGVILIYGGAKKIYRYYQLVFKDRPDRQSRH